MKKISSLLFLLPGLAFFASCRTQSDRADAYGNFEAVEVTISAESNGKVLWMNVEEGQTLAAGQWVALIDTSSLALQRLQIDARIRSLGAKLQDPEPQVLILEEQIQNLVREQKRVEHLLADEAATPKQLDDLTGQLHVLQQQIRSARSQAKTANAAVWSEKDPLLAQRNLIDDQIQKCYVYNPQPGTVLTKYAEAHEVVRFGSPLYKLADLGYLTLRAYISGDQLTNVQVGQEVTVLVDGPKGAARTLKGEVSWIADQAEFTPKTIQTREERVHLVYAIKVRVANDGSLKIGMPGEVWLETPPSHASASPQNEE